LDSVRVPLHPHDRGARGLMRVLIATDAWHPQVNGVARTLTSLARSALNLGVTMVFLTPEGFPSIGRMNWVVIGVPASRAPRRVISIGAEGR
jgi:hypothetical protein